MFWAYVSVGHACRLLYFSNFNQVNKLLSFGANSIVFIWWKCYCKTATTLGMTGYYYLDVSLYVYANIFIYILSMLLRLCKISHQILNAKPFQKNFNNRNKNKKTEKPWFFFLNFLENWRRNLILYCRYLLRVAFNNHCTEYSAKLVVIRV